ncbi:potassium channel family protein [Ectobacillus antri]|uniref:Potassium channel family protein n=1 Tax=Ectobacillus antri TaxID=2486280 RepID=A0ABT6HA03_9BACI|nr:potassium channel family protein [Ectobacillus antri]MDG4658544.1 potassium channel family protein [Ectobacillus antri]MDG5755554.1 potassium channel family protein [Ectobacillus antri]
MVWLGFFLIAAYAFVKSMRVLFMTTRQSGRFFSASNLLLLCSIYTTILIAFGIGYLVLEEMGLPVLEEDGRSLDVHSFEMIEVCMYFSAITLLSVGYGDITPIGIGRWLAIVEALVGYTMPAAFLVHTVIEHEKR